MVELATQYGLYGYRRITALLREEGFRVNHKHRRLWLNDGSCVRLRPAFPDHVWSYDFVFARTSDGRPLRLLTMLDESTRESLAIHVARRITSDDVLGTPARLFVQRGAPRYLRSDNGPEFMARAIRQWLERVDVQTLYIAPGSPWENGYIESFNARLRDESPNGEIFETVLEARVLCERWRRYCNAARLYSSLCYRPPTPETIVPWPGSVVAPPEAKALIGLT